jgi:two-component system, chemotaxis family, chemotaxis protein CheY
VAEDARRVGRRGRLTRERPSNSFACNYRAPPAFPDADIGDFPVSEFQSLFAEQSGRWRVCDCNVSTTPSTVSQSAASSLPARTQPARVLYADDLPELREVMRLILHGEGFQVETVSDGDEALQLITEHPDEFDLLITDHHMPRMNGLELVRRLGATAFRGKIMVFSSELDPQVHHDYHNMGVPVILPKPIRPGVLRKALLDLVPVR